MKETIAKYVGKYGTIKLGGLIVDVYVKDVKNTYGRDRFLVSPVAGALEVWVQTVTLSKKQ